MELRCFIHVCNFGESLGKALRDHLVCRMTSSSTQKKLHAEKILRTLQRAINIAAVSEIAVLDHQQEASMSLQSKMYIVRYKFTCSTHGKRGYSINTCHI